MVDANWTIDLLAVNIQEILEILPTLATKEELGEVARQVIRNGAALQSIGEDLLAVGVKVDNADSRVSDAVREMGDLHKALLEGFLEGGKTNLEIMKFVMQTATQLDKLEAALHERG